MSDNPRNEQELREVVRKKLTNVIRDGGVTVSLLIEQTGITRPTIDGIVKGTTQPWLATLLKLAPALGIEVAPFYTGPTKTPAEELRQIATAILRIASQVEADAAGAEAAQADLDRQTGTDSQKERGRPQQGESA